MNEKLNEFYFELFERNDYFASIKSINSKLNKIL